MTSLRTICSRAFVHTETYASKFADKASKDITCGYSTNSKAYCVCKPSTNRVVKSRNLTFIDTPPGNLPPADDTYGRSTTTFFDALSFHASIHDTQVSVGEEDALARMEFMLGPTTAVEASKCPKGTAPSQSGVASYP